MRLWMSRNLYKHTPKTLRVYCLDKFRTGSRVIYDTPPTDTDDDWIFLIDTSDLDEIEQSLIQNLFKRGGSESMSELKKEISLEDTTGDRSSVFHSWKRQIINMTGSHSDGDLVVDLDTLNIILTCNKEYFENFKLATSLAKYLNLKEKQDRVTLFEAVVFNMWPKYPE